MTGRTRFVTGVVLLAGISVAAIADGQGAKPQTGGAAISLSADSADDLSGARRAFTVDLTGATSPVGTGPVKLTSVPGYMGGDLGNVTWQISGSRISGRALNKRGIFLASFEGTITPRGVSGSFNTATGRVGSWSWEGPVPETWTQSLSNTLRSTLVRALAALFARNAPAHAQVEAGSTVDIPGLGAVDLDRLPPEMAANIRVPGEVYDDEPEEYVDLPAPPDAAVEAASSLSPDQTTAPGAVAAAPDAVPVPSEAPASVPQAAARQEVLKRLFGEPVTNGVPGGTYDKMWQQIE